MRHLLTIALILLSQLTLAYNDIQVSDSLLNVLKSTHTPQKKIQIYRDLADIHLDSPEAKMYLLKMYHEATAIKDYAKMMEALNDILVEEANSNNKDSLIKYIHYLKEVPRPEEVKSLLPLYRMRIFVSQCLTEQKDDAIEKNLQALDTEKNKDNIYNEIASNYTMGVSFYANDKYKEALPYLRKAAKLTESIPSNIKFEYQKMVISKYCYANAQIGNQKESAKVMEKLTNLLEKNYKENYQNRPFFKIDLYRLQYYAFIISCNKELTLEQERFYWNRIQQIGKSLTNTLDKYNYYLCANNYYLNNRTKKDYSKAIAANDSLIKFATALGPQNLPGLYHIHSLIHEEMKDYQNALKYLRISHHMQDSLNTENTQKQLNELQVRYDINTLNNEKAQLEIKNKKILIISLSALLLIVIGVCSYLYLSLKREKRMKAELKILNSKAQESERMKQAFINSICHEIRTPLNAIVGFSDLIMNEDIDKELRREFPAEIQRSTVLLTSLVNNMLEVANLNVSEEKLPCEPTDIRNICIQEMERIIHKEGIVYQLDITEQAMIIPTNVQYLTLVIEHLLSNANKFTENGQITLGYNLNESKDKIFINVTDTGCGIPKEKYDEVFNRFSKLDTFVPGNGLGLYLCRLIMKRLDGEIKIDSDYKEGTRMTVSLPIK
jgi:hypothetical protein